MGRKRFVDLSIAIEDGLPSDPPEMIPKMNYVDHAAGAEQIESPGKDEYSHRHQRKQPKQPPAAARPTGFVLWCFLRRRCRLSDGDFFGVVVLMLFFGRFLRYQFL